MLTYLILAKLPSADDGQTVLTCKSEEDRQHNIKLILAQDINAKLAVAEHWGHWTPETPTNWIDIRTGEVFPKPDNLN
jgi:hypothetical protein